MDIKKIIKEHHQMMIDKGFYDCPLCNGHKEIPIAENLNGDELIEPCSCGDGINKNKNIGELLMLIVTELSEALEAHRNNKFADRYTYSKMHDHKMYPKSECFQRCIKDSFEDEIADVFLRIFDLCGYLNINPDPHRIFISDFEYWENLSKSSNMGENLIRIASVVTLVFHYPYLNQDKYKSQSIELMNIILWRLNILCETFNIPIEKYIRGKMEYNKTRSYKYGKEY